MLRSNSVQRSGLSRTAGRLLPNCPGTADCKWLSLAATVILFLRDHTENVPASQYQGPLHLHEPARKCIHDPNARQGSRPAARAGSDVCDSRQGRLSELPGSLVGAIDRSLGGEVRRPPKNPRRTTAAIDILWVHGWENAVAFRDLARRMPAAVWLDAVPATMDRQLRLRGANPWKRAVAHQIHHRAFRAAAADFDCWLPMASEGARSLERDYGVDPERCFVTLSPQNIEWWAPPPRSFAPPWRALFVGNDFERKGGEFCSGCTRTTWRTHAH